MYKKIIKLQFTLLITLGFICLGFSQNPYSELESDLQLKLNKVVKENNIPGITFSLRFDNQHQINLASGYSDV